MNRSHTREQVAAMKEDAYFLLDVGENHDEVARRIGVTRETIQNWIKARRQGAA